MMMALKNPTKQFVNIINDNDFKAVTLPPGNTNTRRSETSRRGVYISTLALSQG